MGGGRLVLDMSPPPKVPFSTSSTLWQRVNEAPRASASLLQRTRA